MMLTRSSFAVMLKFSEQTHIFKNLVSFIEFYTELNAKDMVKVLKDEKNEDFEILTKRWE